MPLFPHPESAPPAGLAIDASLRRDGTLLCFDYAVTGPIDALRLSPAGAPLRTDGLWAATCFEAFLRAPGSDPYVELNFAPSTRWAAYRFDSWRAGMAPLSMEAPRLVVAKTADTLTLHAEIEAAALPPGPLHVALTAVIEAADGAKSYWALDHAPGKPDFHAAAGFVYEVGA